MGLKGFLRTKVINAVRFAVREELNLGGNRPQLTLNEAGSDSQSISELEERIVQRLDKQIERWTWERFKRTSSLFDSMEYELERELSRGTDSMKKEVAVTNMREIKDVKSTIDEKVKYWTGRRYDQLDKQIERWTWERYKRSEDKLLHVFKLQNQIAELLFEQNKVLYHKGEKVRVMFLFQVASFWPSWESFYNACLNDENIETEFVYLNETVREKVQMETAKDFLDEEKIDYINFDEFEVDEFQPHIIIIQTPYDAGHRIKAHWSSAWKSKGYRIVYVPYGIEISDTETSHQMHFGQHVIENAWRVYTFNDVLRKDYRKYCINAGAVKAVGLPKFDSLYHKEKFIMDEILKEKAAGRKICLWKVHFPKIFEENGKDIFVTPDIHEYIKFAEYAANQQDIFFVFMPHPRFKEPVKNQNLQKLAIELVNILTDCENVYVDEKDDYRYSLVNADYIIIDRSAVMVEAGALGVPVLYMVNDNFYEPVTKGIEPLIDSYYKGTTCDEMIEFLENCMGGIDEKKKEREDAFKDCYPYFDGMSGERIKNNILEALRNELER